MEQNLEIKKQVKGDKTYNNINFKDLSTDNYVIVEKTFAEGMKFTSKFPKKNAKGEVIGDAYTYSIGIKYKDTLCSAWLNQKEHDLYKDVGGVGDKIKVTLYRAEVKLKSGDLLVKKLRFEKVE
jgi:hypothetical protein